MNKVLELMKIILDEEANLRPSLKPSYFSLDRAFSEEICNIVLGMATSLIDIITYNSLHIMVVHLKFQHYISSNHHRTLIVCDDLELDFNTRVFS